MKLKYPVFAIDKNKMVYLFFKEKDLKSTNSYLLKKNVFDKVILIDSSGEVYKIVKAYKVRFIGFWGISLLKKGRQILIDFEFEYIRNYTLSEFKDYIVQCLMSNNFLGEDVSVCDERKNQIMSSSSFSNIAYLLK